jgi:hypothetical protein
VISRASAVRRHVRKRCSTSSSNCTPCPTLDVCQAQACKDFTPDSRNVEIELTSAPPSRRYKAMCLKHDHIARYRRRVQNYEWIWRQLSTRPDSNRWHMPAGMWHGTWNMDVTFPAHARCRHVVSQCEQLQRAQKDREVIPQGWKRGAACQTCDAVRPGHTQTRAGEPINF